eukprot:4935468-Amphidinium_carterae.2
MVESQEQALNATIQHMEREHQEFHAEIHEHMQRAAEERTLLFVRKHLACLRCCEVRPASARISYVLPERLVQE